MDFCGFDNLPLKYKMDMEKLMFEIKSAKKLLEIRKHFNDFSQIYTMLPLLWLEWIKLEHSPQFSDFNFAELKLRRKKIKQLALTHFHCKKYSILDKSAIENGNFEQTLHFSWSTYYRYAMSKCELPEFSTKYGLEKALCFPHSELKNVMEFCSKWSAQPLSLDTVKQYKRSILLYDEISDANLDGDEEKWLIALKKVKKENYIILNIEFRLGENPLNSKLWKLYLKYLNETQPILMLDVYLRYNRIFIDDLQMRKKYWKFIECIGGFKKCVNKWWNDCIQFEKTFINPNSAFLFLKKILSSKTIHPELFLEYLFWFEKVFPNRTCFENLKEQFPSPKAFGGEQQIEYPMLNYSGPPLKMPKMKAASLKYLNIPSIDFPATKAIVSFHDSAHKQIRQNLALPSTVLHYILKNASNELLQRFYKTCKQFYSQKLIPLCHKLTITENAADEETMPKFTEQSLPLSPSHLDLSFLNNLKITNTLYINCPNTSNVFSKLSTKLIYFNLRHLHLISQNLSFQELEKLPCSKIKTVDLRNVNIKTKDGSLMAIEDVIGMFPSSHSFSLCLNEFTPQSAQKLANLKRHSKLEFFKISNINETFDAKSFAEFIMKNYTKQTKSIVCFSNDININYKNAFEKIVKKSIKCWKNAG